MTFAGINYWAIMVAAAAGWITGAVWYGILGNSWMAALDRKKSKMEKIKGTAFYAPFLIAYLANAIMAWILAGIMGHLGPGQVTIRNGVISAAFVWFGFVMTTIVVNNAFAGRKIMLTLIDAGHWLAALMVMAAIIGALGVG
jgi:hypothetical protein